MSFFHLRCITTSEHFLCSKMSVSEDVALKKRSCLKKYISKVFKESSVTVVSSILCTVDNRRKAFRTIVLLICLTGFLYQCITFLGYAFQYPTNLDIDIQKPEFLEVPAYTFCNDNGIVKSKYCAKYPDHCILADESICRRYPRHCTVNKTLVPKKEYYFVDLNITLDDVKELGQNLTEFLVRSNGFNYAEVEGPFVRSKDYFDGSRLGCYSINTLLDSPKDARMVPRQDLIKVPTSVFTFDLQPEEIFVPGDRAGILFSVHSPFIGVNPFERGIFMKAGRTYKIYVRMEQEILLPLPYTTNCLNYTEEWLKRNKTGPRSKEMCVHKCLLQAFKACYNCSPSLVMYPNNERICSSADLEENCADEEILKFYACSGKCKDDCSRFKYIFDVQERYEREKNDPTETMEESGHISVEIYLDDTEIIRLQHKPQYRDVELFSYIGGFIGVWLGVSLVEVMDLLEASCRIFTYVFRKRNTK
ncbi:acid-sensing ion channel 1C-like isoform X2 [Stegodyphus dumicola]|uniref:acid-sensing ion channel 1C-like isoform X2 n=1 Tax=Stegodyphus dumicola TaxID=202533 RepID=UPI0015AD5D95|nr:acid-sensing ion channel 1C-like isoform X2 [Stegodyphus dumicola]